MNPFFRILFALLVIIRTFGLQGQETTESQSLEISVGMGYMMTHDNGYSNFNTFSFGFETTWWYRSFHDDYWRRSRQYPAFGGRASWHRIPKGIAGDRLGIELLLLQPINDKFEYSIGLGFSAYTHPYSCTGDTLNLFIGSLVNCLIDIGVTYRPSDHLFLSLRLLHTSNGMLYRPNQGLNFIQFDFGYTIGTLYPSELRLPTTFDIPTFEEKEIGLALSFGTVMSRRKKQHGYFPCYDLSLNYMHYLSPIFSIGGTLDFWYNFVDRMPILHKHDLHNVPVYFSALCAFESFLGPLSIKAGIGPVVIVSDEVSIPFYERVGLYYNFSRRHQYLGIALNAHAGRIEFIEWTLGFRLR